MLLVCALDALGSAQCTLLLRLLVRESSRACCMVGQIAFLKTVKHPGLSPCCLRSCKQLQALLQGCASCLVHMMISGPDACSVQPHSPRLMAVKLGMHKCRGVAAAPDKSLSSWNMPFCRSWSMSLANSLVLVCRCARPRCPPQWLS